MIEKIIEFSARNRVVVLMLFALLIGTGVWAVYHTPVDAIPDLSDNQVIVFTDYPGRSPQVVEDQVTYPLAVNLQGLPQVRAVEQDIKGAIQKFATANGVQADLDTLVQNVVSGFATPATPAASPAATPPPAPAA